MSEQTSVKEIDAGKTAEQLVAERNQRVLDAVALKQPDRIPTILGFGFLLAEMGGITKQELYEDPVKAQSLLEEAARRFQPDMMLGAWHTPGPSRILGDRMTKWPGLGLGPNGSFQFNEQEFMKPEDYDAFIDDPADWSIRTYMPRAFSELEALSMLPPLGMAAFGYYNILNYTVLTAPPLAEAFQKIGEAAQVQAEWLGEQIDSMQRLAAMGYPPLPFLSTLIEAPFDFMSDTLRGMRGIFLDMLRIPDKLLAAQEKVLTFQVEHAIANAAAAGSPFVFIPLHRGSDGFMSLKQFETFYWKQLKEMMLALIEHDLIPWVYYEGVWDERLEYLADLPAGKSVGMFQDTDLFKAKGVIGDALCIVGGMPLSHLKPGTSPEKIRELTRRLCEEVGDGGGYIMANTVLELEGCDPELIEVWVDATKEYGTYA